MNKVGYQSTWEMTQAFHTKTKTKTAPSKIKAAAVPPKAASPRQAGRESRICMWLLKAEQLLSRWQLFLATSLNCSDIESAPCRGNIFKMQFYGRWQQSS